MRTDKIDRSSQVPIHRSGAMSPGRTMDCPSRAQFVPGMRGMIPSRGLAHQLLVACAMEPYAALRFVEADRVETPAGRLKDFTAVSPTNATLGKLDGVLVDPSQRQVRYYVVKATGRLISRRYLVPAEPAPLETERRTLQLDLEPKELSSCAETDPDSFSRFSAEDAVEAMFAKRLAG